jgi:hypothetical protein
MTYENITYTTYQEVAFARGYVTDELEALECFNMVVQQRGIDSKPHKLRQLFCTMTTQGFPTIRIYKNEAAFSELTYDYEEKLRAYNGETAAFNRDTIENMLLEDFQQRLFKDGKTLGK